MFGTKRLFELGYFWMVDINAFKCFNNTQLCCAELKALMVHERMFNRWQKSIVNFNKMACNFRIIIFWFACFNLDYVDYSLLGILCSGGLHDLKHFVSLHHWNSFYSNCQSGRKMVEKRGSLENIVILL